jgi:hypothetical protein
LLAALFLELLQRSFGGSGGVSGDDLLEFVV